MNKTREPQKALDCMTDNEIIKALECCMDEMGCTKGCPCFNPKAKGSHCTVAKKLELEKLTLDLINRQQVEIAILSAKRANIFEIVEAYERGRTEAVVEFIDRLTELYSHCRYDRPNAHTLIGALFKNVDNIAREMLGDVVCEKPKVDGGKL